MQENNRADKISRFIEICHENNLKITPQRIAIYKGLLNLHTHPSVDDIFRIVKREYPNISFDTVNRTLLTFAEIGLVDVVEIFGGAKRFDPNVKNHHHLHCTKCGKILDVYSREFDDLKIPGEISAKFQIISKRVILKGICRECGN